VDLSSLIPKAYACLALRLLSLVNFSSKVIFEKRLKRGGEENIWGLFLGTYPPLKEQLSNNTEVCALTSN